MISVVIPAHDEEAVIGRLLRSLQEGRMPDDEVVVVCDGCVDSTAEVARRFEGIRVLELPRGGKPSALNAGDRVSSQFPRFFVDADVDVTMASLHEVARAMTGVVRAGAPTCVVDRSRSSSMVRRYYDVWTRLPYFTKGLLGSGVVGVTEEGRARFSEFPDVIGDDYFVWRLFADDERIAPTNATFTITAPRTLGALIRVKTRSRLGVLQLDETLGKAPKTSGSESAVMAAVRLCRAPRFWFPVAVYATIRGVIYLESDRRFRRRDFAGWERDDTSRAQGA